MGLDFLRLRFFVSQGRKNSVRDKVIGKRWVCLERYPLHGQHAVCLSRQERPGEKHSLFSSWPDSKPPA